MHRVAPEQGPYHGDMSRRMYAIMMPGVLTRDTTASQLGCPYRTRKDAVTPPAVGEYVLHRISNRTGQCD